MTKNVSVCFSRVANLLGSAREVAPGGQHEPTALKVRNDRVARPGVDVEEVDLLYRPAAFDATRAPGR